MLKKAIHYWFQWFITIFLFATINRELSLFGIDGRVYVVASGLMLLGLNIFSSVYDKSSNIVKIFASNLGSSKLLFLLMTLAVVGNVMWLFNGLEIAPDKFLVVFAGVAYNLFVLGVITINKRLIVWRRHAWQVLLAGAVLIASILTSWAGFNLRNFGSAYPGGYIDRLSPSILSHVRYGGYAQDPNYATLFLIFIIAVAAYLFVKNRKNPWPLFIIPPAVIGILLSASKALLIMVPIAAALAFLPYKRFTRIARDGLLLVIVLATLLVAAIHTTPSGIQTLETRFNLWRSGFHQVTVNPITGSGLTSVRSAIAEDKWYVQAHSSIIQVAVELGVIGLVLLIVVLRRNLMSANNFVVFMTVIFLAHAATHETMYQAYFLLFLGLLPLLTDNVLGVRKTTKRQDVAVFVINTLSNGGAERVVQNMANHMAVKGKVIIYTLYRIKQQTYTLSEGVEVINLGHSRSKLFAPLLAYRLTSQLDSLASKYNIAIATAHLPFASLVARLSAHRRLFMHVAHGFYGAGHKGISGKLMRFIYGGQQIIAVSRGFMYGDILGKYAIKTNTITTIYNPVDFSEIDRQLVPRGLKRKKEILWVGRMADQKDPIAAARVFVKSGLANKGYKLVFLGDGELRPQLEGFIVQADMRDNIIIKGRVNNPFRYMQESAMLLIASRYEAFTMVAIEAMYCECPVVAYDLSYGINELMTGDLLPYMAKNHDEDDLARVMNLAIASYPSGLRKHVVDMVDSSKIVQQYYKKYKEWNQ